VLISFTITKLCRFVIDCICAISLSGVHTVESGKRKLAFCPAMDFGYYFARLGKNALANQGAFLRIFPYMDRVW
jgi:hypothetical protein